jgi:hypothetical protein
LTAMMPSNGTPLRGNGQMTPVSRRNGQMTSV